MHVPTTHVLMVLHANPPLLDQHTHVAVDKDTLGLSVKYVNTNISSKSFHFTIQHSMYFNFPDDPCYTNPCLNGATCQSSGFGYYCNCPQFYSGVNCQQCKIFEQKKNTSYHILLYNFNFLDTNACSLSPCLNGGTCQVLNTNSNSGYSCSCQNGFSGTNCQTCKVYISYIST